MLKQDPHAVSIIYIESNTGDSSGGHAAIRTGRDVFHFQHSEHGRLLLKRDQWDFFRFYYNDLGNRDMHAADLDLPQDATLKIWTSFTALLLKQDAWFAGLRARERDVELLRALNASAATFNLRGAGFFLKCSTVPNACSTCLRQDISLAFGTDFLSSRIKALKASLKHLPQADGWKDITADSASASMMSASRLAKYREQISNLAALEIIQQCRGLNQDVLVRLPAEPANPCLTPAERKELIRWGEMFKKSIFSLLVSRRPDYGFAVMLATARYLAIQESLEKNRLVMLDTFPDDASLVDPVEDAGSERLLGKMAASEKKRLTRTGSWLIKQQKTDELRWTLLENRAARCAELCACAAGKSHMRVSSGTPVPTHSGPASLLQPDNIKNLAPMLGAAMKDLELYREHMEKQWSYNLFTRNCVTELLNVTHQALCGSANAKPSAVPCGHALASMSFIPWLMFQQACKYMTPDKIEFYPSYRHRQLLAMYRTGNAPLVYIREFNTLTSTIYDSGKQDSAFLMFTDDVLLPRPLLGAINLAWALPRTGLGILLWPLDAGRMFRSGALGTLFSLPELVFINIRKGSFAYIQDIDE